MSGNKLQELSKALLSFTDRGLLVGNLEVLKKHTDSVGFRKNFIKDVIHELEGGGEMTADHWLSNQYGSN